MSEKNTYDRIFENIGKSLTKESVRRRDFIKGTLLTGASLLLSPMLSKVMAEETGWRIVQNQIKSTIGMVTSDASISSPRNVNQKVVRKMFEEALKTAMGVNNINEAWQKVFPHYKKTQVILFKLTCLNPYNSSHKELVYEMADSLIKWGVKPNDIIIFERTAYEMQRQKYTINHSSNGIRCFGTTNPGYSPGYDESITIPLREGLFIGGLPHFSKVISRMCSYIINVPVLKRHIFSGVTLSLKNHYGSFNNPASYHDNQCDPYLAKLNSHPVIKEKTKLVVLDALACNFIKDQGGYPDTLTKSLLVGTDPVAIDTTGLMMIEDLRIKKHQPSIMNQCIHIATAAEMSLGTNNPANINLIKKTL